MQEALQGQATTPRRFINFLAFMRSESTGGLSLITAATVALIWSNTGEAGYYFRLLELPIGFSFDGHQLMLPLVRWVNDGLMAVFFLTVGLEIRREFSEGQLSDLQKAAAPGLAALGGMIVPALIYVGINFASPETLHGWAVPVATDIAFALAALAVLGRRVPIGLRVFLTALAILDDLGAILVIALFYTEGLDFFALGGAVVLIGILYGLNRAGVRALSPYVLGGAILWGCLFNAGVHPTLAGVALAFVVPMTAGENSPAHRLEAGLGGWVTWGVLPLFGLANAGLQLDGIEVSDFGTPVMLGTLLGLVIGKPVGVFGATMVALRLGIARLPPGLSLVHLGGGAVLCGIGFTMSLFLGDLSFSTSLLHAEVKLAVFVGSVTSAILGMILLAVSRPVRLPASLERS